MSCGVEDELQPASTLNVDGSSVAAGSVRRSSTLLAQQVTGMWLHAVSDDEGAVTDDDAASSSSAASGTSQANEVGASDADEGVQGRVDQSDPVSSHDHDQTTMDAAHNVGGGIMTCTSLSFGALAEEHDDVELKSSVLRKADEAPTQTNGAAHDGGGGEGGMRKFFVQEQMKYLRAVNDGVITEVSSEEALRNVGKDQQGDHAFYTEEAIAQRAKLRESPSVRRMMKQLWAFMPKHHVARAAAETTVSLGHQFQLDENGAVDTRSAFRIARTSPPPATTGTVQQQASAAPPRALENNDDDDEAVAAAEAAAVFHANDSAAVGGGGDSKKPTHSPSPRQSPSSPRQTRSTRATVAAPRHTPESDPTKVWWQIAPPGTVPVVNEAIYMAFCARLTRRLVKKVTPAECVELLRQEWKADSRNGGEFLSFQAFSAAMFELIDVWCPTAELEEYEAFYDRVLKPVAVKVCVLNPDKPFRLGTVFHHISDKRQRRDPALHVAFGRTTEAPPPQATAGGSTTPRRGGESNSSAKGRSPSLSPPPPAGTTTAAAAAPLPPPVVGSAAKPKKVPRSGVKEKTETTAPPPMLVTASVTINPKPPHQHQHHHPRHMVPPTATTTTDGRNTDYSPPPSLFSSETAEEAAAGSRVKPPALTVGGTAASALPRAAGAGGGVVAVSPKQPPSLHDATTVDAATKTKLGSPTHKTAGKATIPSAPTAPLRDGSVAGGAVVASALRPRSTVSPPTTTTTTAAHLLPPKKRGGTAQPTPQPPSASPVNTASNRFAIVGASSALQGKRVSSAASPARLEAVDAQYLPKPPSLAAAGGGKDGTAGLVGATTSTTTAAPSQEHAMVGGTPAPRAQRQPPHTPPKSPPSTASSKHRREGAAAATSPKKETERGSAGVRSSPPRAAAAAPTATTTTTAEPRSDTNHEIIATPVVVDGHLVRPSSSAAKEDDAAGSSAVRSLPSPAVVAKVAPQPSSSPTQSQPLLEKEASAAAAAAVAGGDGARGGEEEEELGLLLLRTPTVAIAHKSAMGRKLTQHHPPPAFGAAVTSSSSPRSARRARRGADQSDEGRLRVAGPPRFLYVPGQSSLIRCAVKARTARAPPPHVVVESDLVGDAKLDPDTASTIRRTVPVAPTAAGRRRIVFVRDRTSPTQQQQRRNQRTSPTTTTDRVTSTGATQPLAATMAQQSLPFEVYEAYDAPHLLHRAAHRQGLADDASSAFRGVTRHRHQQQHHPVAKRGGVLETIVVARELVSDATAAEQQRQPVWVQQRREQAMARRLIHAAGDTVEEEEKEEEGDVVDGEAADEIQQGKSTTFSAAMQTLAQQVATGRLNPATLQKRGAPAASSTNRGRGGRAEEEEEEEEALLARVLADAKRKAAADHRALQRKAQAAVEGGSETPPPPPRLLPPSDDKKQTKRTAAPPLPPVGKGGESFSLAPTTFVRPPTEDDCPTVAKRGRLTGMGTGHQQHRTPSFPAAPPHPPKRGVQDRNLGGAARLFSSGPADGGTTNGTKPPCAAYLDKLVLDACNKDSDVEANIDVDGDEARGEEGRLLRRKKSLLDEFDPRQWQQSHSRPSSTRDPPPEKNGSGGRGGYASSKVSRCPAELLTAGGTHAALSADGGGNNRSPPRRLVVGDGRYVAPLAPRRHH